MTAQQDIDIVAHLTSAFDEEIGCLKLLFERHKTSDYLEYRKRIIRVQLIEELAERIGFKIRFSHERLEQIKALMNENPFEPPGGPKNMDQFFFKLRCRTAQL